MAGLQVAGSRGLELHDDRAANTVWSSKGSHVTLGVRLTVVGDFDGRRRIDGTWSTRTRAQPEAGSGRSGTVGRLDGQAAGILVDRDGRLEHGSCIVHDLLVTAENERLAAAPDVDEQLLKSDRRVGDLHRRRARGRCRCRAGFVDVPVAVVVDVVATLLCRARVDVLARRRIVVAVARLRTCCTVAVAVVVHAVVLRDFGALAACVRVRLDLHQTLLDEVAAAISLRDTLLVALAGRLVVVVTAAAEA